VIIDDPQPGIELTYVQQTGDSHANTDGGDQYTGLDRFGRVIDQFWLNTSTNTATDRSQYGYDQDGNVLFKSNLVNTAFSKLYHANGSGNGYDGLNQLTAFARGTLNGTNDTISSPSATNSWATDAAGNFTSIGGTSETNNKQNEATAFGSATLTYDGNGNLTTDQSGNILVYDAWNRLVAYKNGSTVLETLAYDGLGRRIVENPGTARDLYYSKDWQVLEERIGGAAKAHYVWSPVYVDALVLRDRDTGGGTLSERLWAQQDANWNVTALVSSAGSVVERYAYDPYGTVIVLSSAWGSLSGSSYAWIVLFQGGRWDATTGLYDFRERPESPALARWTRVDPKGFSARDVNFYRYIGDRPTSATDPSGLQASDQDGSWPLPASPIPGHPPLLPGWWWGHPPGRPWDTRPYPPPNPWAPGGGGGGMAPGGGKPGGGGGGVAPGGGKPGGGGGGVAPGGGMKPGAGVPIPGGGYYIPPAGGAPGFWYGPNGDLWHGQTPPPGGYKPAEGPPPGWEWEPPGPPGGGGAKPGGGGGMAPGGGGRPGGGMAPGGGARPGPAWGGNVVGGGGTWTLHQWLEWAATGRLPGSRPPSDDMKPPPIRPPALPGDPGDPAKPPPPDR
jgi:RHS repeat-associated protein